MKARLQLLLVTLSLLAASLGGWAEKVLSWTDGH